MTCSAADQTTEHISSSLICRHDTVRDHKCCGTDMVCDKTNRNIVIVFFSIFFSRNLAYKVTKRADSIHIKNRIYVLNNNRKTLQSHTGINVFLFQSFVVAVSVVLKLGKYVIPYFHVTVAFTAYCTAFPAAAVFFPSVIINFRTGTAWTCAMLPEVVFFSETENALCRNAYFFIPDVKRFVIFQVNRRIKAFRIKSHYLC